MGEVTLLPEMPEVETLRRGLVRAAVGQRITEVQVTDERVLKRCSIGDFAERLTDTTIKAVNRRGKFLLFEMGCGSLPSFHLVVHLNMKGRIRRFAADVPMQKYECVRVGLSTGDVLAYTDMWTWGGWQFDDASEYTQASGLDAGECDALAVSIAETLGNAVRLGGSFGEYVDLDGNPGTYEPRVYGGKGKPCPQCGGLLVKTSIGGRGTTYCPECQH